MEIVKADIALLNEVTALFNEYRMFYDQQGDEKAAREFIKSRILNDDSIIFVAMNGERAGGFVQLYPTFSSIGMQRVYILNDLYVNKENRKRGTGRLLMQHAFQYCELEKVKYITLETRPDNHTAKSLYESMGMILSNTYDSYVKYF